MTCAELDELVWLAIDDELSADERRMLDAHLATCAACRARVAESRRVADGLRRLDAPHAPEGFTAGTLARLEQRPALRVLPGWRALAAAAVVVLLVGTWAWNSTRSKPAMLSEEIASAPERERLEREAAAPKRGLLTDGEDRDAPESSVAKNKKLDDTRGGFDEHDGHDGQDAPAVALESDSKDEESSVEPAPEERAGYEQRVEGAEGAEGKVAPPADAGETRRQKAGEPPPPAAAAVPAASALPPSPILVLVQEAASAKAALDDLDSLITARKLAEDEKSVDEVAKGDANRPAGKPEHRSEATPVRTGVAPGLAGLTKEEKAAKEAADDQKAVAPEKVEFLVVPRDAAATTAWLRDHPDAATRNGVAVVEVTPEELRSLTEALERARQPAERVEAQAWLERATTDAVRARDDASKDNASKETGPAKTRGRTVGKAPEPKEAKKAARPRVRVVLWLAPPPAAPQKD